VRSLLFWN